MPRRSKREESQAGTRVMQEAMTKEKKMTTSKAVRPWYQDLTKEKVQRFLFGSKEVTSTK